MDHPNVARVIDGGLTATGVPYLVMELVPGLLLLKFCDEARLPVRDRLELFEAVCQGAELWDGQSSPGAAIDLDSRNPVRLTTRVTPAGRMRRS